VAPVPWFFTVALKVTWLPVAGEAGDQVTSVTTRSGLDTGAGVGDGVGPGVGLGVGAGVGDGVGEGVGDGVEAIVYVAPVDAARSSTLVPVAVSSKIDEAVP